MRLPKGESCRNTLYRNYKDRAKRANIVFALSVEEFQGITSSPCHYCGKPPSQIIQNKYSPGPYVYNGVDRKSSTGGYTTDNCVPCCWTCNDMKKASGYDEFINHIKAIHNNLNLYED